MSSPKEPIFFELDREYEKGKSYYRDTYYNPDARTSILGDARPRNLFLPWVPERITSMFPEARFVVILRDPVKRAHSFYWASRRSGMEGTETLNFESAIFENYRRLQSGRTYDTPEMKRRYQEEYEPRGDGKFKTYLEGGYYVNLIDRYRKRTHRNRIKVVLLRDFVKNPLQVCNELFSFLEVPLRDTLDQPHHMQSYQSRSVRLQKLFVHLRNLIQSLRLGSLVPGRLRQALQSLNVGERSLPEIKPLAKLWLYEHYREKNNRLEEFMNRSLKRWNSDALENLGS
jgi:hypothetical protein